MRVCFCACVREGVCARVRARIGTLQPQHQRMAATHPAGLIIAAEPAGTYVLHDRAFVRTPSAATRSFCPPMSRPPRRASRVLDKNNPRRPVDGEMRRLHTQHQAGNEHRRRSNSAPCDGGSISAVKDGRLLAIHRVSLEIDLLYLNESVGTNMGRVGTPAT